MAVLILTLATERHVVTDMTPEPAAPRGANFLNVTVALDVLLNALSDPLLHETLRQTNRILHGLGRRVTMRNDTGAVDPEKWCAAVFGGIGALPDVIECRVEEQGGQAPPERFGETGF